MKKEILRKIAINKKNNQLSIVIPRKFLDPKGKLPTKVRLRYKDLVWSR